MLPEIPLWGLFLIVFGGYVFGYVVGWNERGRKDRREDEG